MMESKMKALEIVWEYCRQKEVMLTDQLFLSQDSQEIEQKE
jgi:hypothetical protein